ncbi:MAG: hypothetical protein GY810_06690 [Aureispira sp.]|nr:hypothetical protein [Aureispira sp.]
MKTLLILMLALTTFANAQTGDKDEVTKIVGNYFKEIQDRKWDKVPDYLYPKLFEGISKEDMVATMKLIDEDEDFSTTFDALTITSTSDKLKVGKEEFVRVHYVMQLTFKVYESNDDGVMMTILLNNFKAAYGNNVKEISGNKIEVFAPKTMIAIAPKGTSDWKLLEYNRSNPEAVEAFLPKKVIKKFDLD